MMSDETGVIESDHASRDPVSGHPASLRRAGDKLADEAQAVDSLLKNLRLDAADRAAIKTEAAELVTLGRARRASEDVLDAFLHAYDLSTEEGVALMCLAEALLRVPDGRTANALIAEKISGGAWASHAAGSDRALVRASAQALDLTSRVIDLARGDGGLLGTILGRMGEPGIRRVMLRGMRVLGGHFVLGRTIGEALSRGARRQKGRLLYSFDMLGEGARSAADAERHFRAYRDAIKAIGAAARVTGGGSAGSGPTGSGPDRGPGVSIKLSALHPRYEPAQRDRVMKELYPRLLDLALAARRHDIGFTVDAEEADRLELSLELFDRLIAEPGLAEWTGLGLAVQAYQKRAIAVIDHVVAAARRQGRRLMVRLVKGAYWDSEIKRAQMLGLTDFPVFTRKEATDLSYMAAAERLMAAIPDVMPQFATHNAFTVAAILRLGRDRPVGSFEFQRLHGMGDLLHGIVAERQGALPVACRVYAPVGSHEDLLPYLVRRLLENGANSSFLNQFLDPAIPVDDVVVDPVEEFEAGDSYRHPSIRLPEHLFSPIRVNSGGIDLADPDVAATLAKDLARAAKEEWFATPIIAGRLAVATAKPLAGPAYPGKAIGGVVEATEADIAEAVATGLAAQPDWDAAGGAARAAILDRMADSLASDRDGLLSLLTREAGKTLPDAVAEWREAVDFLRFYAAEARRLFAHPIAMPGPVGETNALSLHGRGVFACISPWNFPLAIFTGQIAAALAAGNAVIAKPAPQTPLVAAEAVRLFFEAGLSPALLSFLPGGTSVGRMMVGHPDIAGVAFTGSTAAARAINRSLAKREGPILPLIAETGGLNAMIVDSTALLEQTADDIIQSAFGSAGQRCSALRVLFVQTEIADRLIAILRGAMRELQLGDPALLSTDIGPIIDKAARTRLLQHTDTWRARKRILAWTLPAASLGNGWFFPPTLIELDDISDLPGEVFGPVLHLIRYDAARLDAVIAEIRATGYGLTLGIQSRIEATARRVVAGSRVGNIYVNRAMTGAVVGVQPFGGEGLSGTGPKAGGPFYLPRFATERVVTTNIAAAGGNAALFSLSLAGR